MRHFLIVIFLVCLFCTSISAQELSFNNASLIEVLNDIEERTALKFNYDPELLSNYKFTGEIVLTDLRNTMVAILKDTPLSFEISGSYVLITQSTRNEYHLCGYITDNLGKEIAGADIYTKDATVGISSDSNGYFSINVKGQKDEKIIISHLGFENVELTISDFIKTDCLTVRLEERSYELDGVTLNYILEGISEGSGYGATSINSNTLFENNSLQEFDILKIAQLLPGISSVDESASNLNIRGSTADQNLVVLDGVTLYGPSHVLGLISAINPFIVDKIDVYKSVYNPIYENRIGGIVDISLPNKINNTFEGGIGTTLADSHVYFSMPIVKDRLSLLASGRYVTNKYFDSPIINSYSEKIFSTTIVGEESPAAAVGFKTGDDQLDFSDFNVKAVYRPTENIFAAVSYFRSQDKTNFISNAAGDDLQSNESVFNKTEAISTNMQIDWNDNFSSRLYFSSSKYQNENRSLFSNNAENGFSFNNISTNQIDDIKFRLTSKFFFKKDTHLGLGYSANLLNVDYFIDQNSNSEIDFSGMNSSKGNFHNLISSFNLNRNDFILTAGLRGTYYKEFNTWYFSPRLNFQYLLNDAFKFKLSSGIFHQFINQLEIVGNKTINARSNLWILSNEETGQQLNSKKTTFGFVYRPKNWLLDVEAYYHETTGISSLSTLLDADSLIEGAGKSNIIGIDFLIKRNWEYFNFWLNYTLSKNTYSLRSSDFNRFPANIDQLHNLSIFNTLELGKWDFSLTYNFKSGLPFSIPSGIEQVMSENNQNRLTYDSINGKRLAHYSRLDFGVSYKTKFMREKLNLEIALSLLNIFNRKNIFSRDFFIGDLESSQNLKINSIERFQLKRTPQLLLRVHW